MDTQEPSAETSTASTETSTDSSTASTETSTDSSTETSTASTETSTAASDPQDARAQFRELPAPVRVEDTITVHPAVPAPDPTPGGDPDTDWLLRNAG